MRIAILGAHGQLGSELCRQLGITAVPISRNVCDLTNRDAVLRTLAQVRPSAVINTAAYNQVDKAEQEPDVCRAINAHSVRYVTEACRELDCVLAQVSTSYVFSGEGRSTPYGEDEPTCPLTVYGQTKREGEEWAAQWTRHYIVRIGGLFGPRHATSKVVNFVDLMLRLGQTLPVVRVVNDQFGSPSHVKYIAQAIRYLLEAQPPGRAAYGIYHVANQGITTWHGLAAEIFQRIDLPARLKAVSTAEFGAAAHRPAYAVLNTAKYQGLQGPVLPSWQHALAEYLSALGDSWRLPIEETRREAA